MAVAQNYSIGDLTKIISTSKQGQSKSPEKHQKKERKQLASLFGDVKSKKLKVVNVHHSSGLPQVSTQTVEQHDVISTDNKKKKKVKTEQIISAASDTQPHQEGFCPPKGIIHESLLVNDGNKRNKRKHKSDFADSPPKHRKRELSPTEDSDQPMRDSSEDTEVTGKSKFTDRQKQREHRKFKDKKKDLKTVFVGNLPIGVTKKRVIKMFRDLGGIESVRFRCPPVADPRIPKKVVAIKKDFHDQRHNIVAYVRFEEEETAQKALALNGLLVDDLHIRVDLAAADKKHDNKQSVFVGNIPFTAEEEALREHFEQCGDVENVRIIRDGKTGLGKGFCYISFHSKDAVDFALKLNNKELLGRELRVTRCVDNPRKAAKKEEKHSAAVSKPKKNFVAPSNVRTTSQAFRGMEARKKQKKKQKKAKAKTALKQRGELGKKNKFSSKTKVKDFSKGHKQKTGKKAGKKAGAIKGKKKPSSTKGKQR